MTWITLGEKEGKIILVSKGISSLGIIHIGSYLTAEDVKNNKKFILRVEESYQTSSFDVSPLLVDMDLEPLVQDQITKNIVIASRIAEIPEREDGISSYIKPLIEARHSNQEEINIIFGNEGGVPIFPATVYAKSCQVLKDEKGHSIIIRMPEDVFFHQILITGATGSGKTVAMKYLSQYFVENLNKEEGNQGAVLAVNVKEEDLLYMDKPTQNYSQAIKKEWDDLGLSPHGIRSFRIYYPGNKRPSYSEKVDITKCQSITLKTENLEPENLSGLIPNLTLLGSEQLPNIFRYWREYVMEKGNTMRDFIHYFDDPNKKRNYKVLTANGDIYDFTIHAGTFNSIRNALTTASEYFDIPDAKELTAKDILERQKMSVIDVSSKKMIGFGSVLLRNIVDKIYLAKSQKDSEVPVLLIIDEVHEFYSNQRSEEALETLDAIARKGRSLGIGVIFASQNPDDIPNGISQVVNTHITFKGSVGKMSVKSQFFDPDGLRPGYAIAKIHGLSEIKLIKFPLSMGGVYIEQKR